MCVSVSVGLKQIFDYSTSIHNKEYSNTIFDIQVFVQGKYITSMYPVYVTVNA